jgi:hypothetical protein
MLRSKIGEGGPLKTYGFLVGIEVEGDPDLEFLTVKLADSVKWVEGVGTVDVESLGEVDVYEQTVGDDVV